MKKVIYIAALAVVMASCAQKESDHHFSNVLYFSGGASVADIRVGEEDASLTRSISVEMAIPESKEIKFNVSVDESKLDSYRSMYQDSEAQILPAANYELSASEVSMAEGFVTSDPIVITFKNTNALPDLSKHYVLPLTLSSADVTPLGSGSTLYYVLSKASLINVVADITDNRAWPIFDNQPTFKDMTTFTMEALVNATTFKRNNDEGGKIEHPLATVMGIEDRFLIRVGDTLIPENQIQVAWAQQDGEGSTKRGNISNAAMQIKAGRWYHIAVTFDAGAITVYLNGVNVGEANSSDIGVTSVDFSTVHSEEDDGKPRCFWIGYSYDKWRYWNGRISEARIWNKALTAEEINADKHFYQVDPASEGLVAYWKFDDGAGAVVKDYSALGNDLTCQLPPSWYPASLPEE